MKYAVFKVKPWIPHFLLRYKSMESIALFRYNEFKAQSCRLGKKNFKYF